MLPLVRPYITLLGLLFFFFYLTLYLYIYVYTYMLCATDFGE